MLSSRALWVLGLVAAAACGKPVGAAPATNKAPGLLAVDGPALIEHVRSLDRRRIIVNVWATWCEPCVEELPDLLRLGREHKDVALVLVTADFPSEHEAALKFLQKIGAPLPSYAQSGKEDAFIAALDPSWTGALPITVIFDRGGKRLKTIRGKTTYDELVRALAEP